MNSLFDGNEPDIELQYTGHLHSIVYLLNQIVVH